MNKDYRELLINGMGEIGKLERFIEDICDYYNINNEYFGNILLATTESAEILFSINSDEPNNILSVIFDRNAKGLIFKIKLKNSTSDTDENEDYLDREIRKHKLAKEIFIIKSLTDEITISVNAKSIVLIFYVSSMNYEKSLYRINKLKEYWHTTVDVKEKK